MKKFNITVTDNFLGEFIGEFHAETEAQAVEKAKGYYAVELDTTEDAIEVVSSERIAEER